jgi:hypothetical protein
VRRNLLLGLHLHLKSGEVAHVPCCLEGDRCTAPAFANDLLGKALRQIADRRGVKVIGDR